MEEEQPQSMMALRVTRGREGGKARGMKATHFIGLRFSNLKAAAPSDIEDTPALVLSNFPGRSFDYPFPFVALRVRVRSG